ncbi:nuclear transport factor 2 family protein [Herbaspirillum robiniae]|uniref:Isomerase n=1 Tax=Herbaspirillum robiniae TaxID=2014887 RepID=A0A246WP99_9BURK|nr:nuclear transport factor 2 family protein [Herbaspirillum robiniae]OWY28193.1 isomerase [Herbaspirillum robiniae]
MDAIDQLLAWYATIDRQSLARIDEFYAPEARFKDPFNDVQGIGAIRNVFEHMFDTTEAPRFVILERMQRDSQAFATWRFEFTLKGKPYTVLGATHFRLDADGRVIEHRDYWDAAEELWQKLPLLGRAVAWLRSRFATPPNNHYF